MDPRTRCGVRPALHLGAAAVMFTALAGCTTLGGNIKGSFSCKAPGGTCAPSTAIDDAAIASMKGGADGDLTAPAGPYTPDSPVPDAGTQAVAMTTPAAPGGRVLRIVFPAYVDRFGRFHDKSSVQTTVGAAVASVGVPPASGIDLGANQPGLLGAAESAPPLFADTATSSIPALTGSAGPIKVANAQATVAKVSPIDQIKADVARRVEAAPRAVPTRKAANFTGFVE